MKESSKKKGYRLNRENRGSTTLGPDFGQTNKTPFILDLILKEIVIKGIITSFVLDYVRVEIFPQFVGTVTHSEFFSETSTAASQQIWFSDSNANPSKGSAKSQAWRKQPVKIRRSLRYIVVTLSRVGKTLARLSGGSAPLATLGRMKGTKTLATWTSSPPRRCSQRNS